jgi:hypothetical protein
MLCLLHVFPYAFLFVILPVAVVVTACIVLAVGFQSLQHNANI